jgi:hypothetical protein
MEHIYHPSVQSQRSLRKPDLGAVVEIAEEIAELAFQCRNFTSEIFRTLVAVHVDMGLSA